LNRSKSLDLDDLIKRLLKSMISIAVACKYIGNMMKDIGRIHFELEP